MSEEIKKIIKQLIEETFGTQNNISFKLSCAFFISGILYLIFTSMSQQQNPLASKTFSIISGILLTLWLLFIQGNNSVMEIVEESFRIITFFIMFIFSMDFCINTSINAHGLSLIVKAILSCFGILFFSFYLISKFIDIFHFFKNILKKIKEKIFNSTESATSKTKTLIENVTTFLVSITGLGVAIKAIIEPLINLFK